VALLSEAVALRRVLGAEFEHDIYVLNGVAAGEEQTFAEHALIPLLNTPGDIERWGEFARQGAAGGGGRGGGARAVLQLDTGMSRLGLSPAEVAALAAAPHRLDGIALDFIISHLACAYDQGDPQNQVQLDRFNALRGTLPVAPASVANSSAIFLGPQFHFDLARPGASLFGVAPLARTPNPMAQVINLQGKVVQVRDVDSGQTVGYGATHRVTRRSRFATVAVGYADGYLRSLSNRGSGFIADVRVPVVGRISMDLTTFDVTDVPEADVRPGAFMELIGPRHGVDELAAEAGTIGYEILTALGQRFDRRYVGGEGTAGGGKPP
jgi:alanine racemase